MDGVERRAAAIGSLALAAGAAAFAVALAIERWPHGIVVLAVALLALWAGWIGLRREGLAQMVAIAVAVGAVTATILLVILTGGLLANLVVLAAFVGSVALARVAFRVHVDLPAAPAPHRPFLFFNPLSGGGKAERFHLADEARRRGILPVELRRGMDLRTLVEDAVAAGADGLAMAGGDGSQAIVAEIAATHGLPYACIPAGTRNHFALDLGVDRDDVVGALDAFVDGGERRVDLGDVNGRVFVNNVSIGLYADAVQRSGYRDAKIRTLVAMAPEGVRQRPPGAALHWPGPDGDEGRDAVAVLVSNDPYRLGTALGSATRPHLDAGVLGVAVASIDEAHRGIGRLRSWSCPTFTVDADGPVAAGIDGEACTLEPPIRFTSVPRALTVRIAKGHPGASPATAVPRGLPATAMALVRIALGRDPAEADDLDRSREESSDERFRGRATRDPHPR